MKSIILFILILISGLSFGQNQNIIEPERIENAVHKNHINKIVFLNKAISLENIKESDLIKIMTFQEDKDFDIRVFLDNSLVNYLHQLDPDLSADELLKKEIINLISLLTEN
ncbi:hypothetical protein [Chryseobacterium wanjuense]